jgi:phosphatidylglycerol---prolipoprotein diacylglyceryl transferase
MIEFFPSRTVAMSIGAFPIHWYGLLYAVAFLVGVPIAQFLAKKAGLLLTVKQWNAVANAVILGVILGGRVGYMFLYELHSLLQNPLSLFAVWQGGMSSHGGFIGVAIALLYVARVHKIPLLPLIDVLTVPIALGLMLGRIGNMINQELYGSITTLPWAVSIPNVEGLRHPTAEYSAIKDLFLAGICLLGIYMRVFKFPGVITGYFLIAYSVLRFSIEFIRVPTHAVIWCGFFTCTRGQLFSIPLCIVGCILLYISFKRAQVMRPV